MAKKDDALLREIRERFDDTWSRDSANREAQRADMEFIHVPGKQWDEKVRKRWGNSQTLEFPQLTQFRNQVINDQRQNRPGVRVHPAGGEASEEVAEIIQGVVRGIEYESQAEACYDNAFGHAVDGGRGYWRIVAEYVSPRSFDRKLVIKPVADPGKVLLDPDFMAPDGSDITFGYVFETLSQEQFKAEYPEAEPVSWQPSEAGGTSRWYEGKERVVVADYYRRVAKPRELVLMSDGNVFWRDEIPAGIVMPEGVTELDSRMSEEYVIEWYKCAGGEQILDTYEWPGTIIPIVCVMGDTVMIDGKRQFQGLVRRAKDAQRMYNYEKSMKAKQLAMQPLAPFVADEESVRGYEHMWNTANETEYSVLLYRGKDKNGNPLPMPQRSQFATPPSGWAEAANSDKADIRSIIGMYEQSLGMRGTETSGRAIIAREKQGDNATFHFMDNMSRAIALTGRILVECIPYFYDSKRLVTVVDKDDTRRLVTLNEPGSALVNGALQAIVNNDVTVGEYAVTVEAGPSYATARQETRDALLQLAQSDPRIMQIAGDIVVGAMEFPDAEELAERLKLVLPPNIQQHIAAKEGGDDPRIAAMGQQMQAMQQQAQAALGQAQQMAQQAGQRIAELEAQVANGQIDAKAAALKLQEENATLRVRLQDKESTDSLALAADQVKVEAAKVSVEKQALAVERAAFELEKKEATEELTDMVAGAVTPQEAPVNGQHSEMMDGMASEIAKLNAAMEKLAGIVTAPRKSIPHRNSDGVITHIESVLSH